MGVAHSRCTETHHTLFTIMQAQGAAPGTSFFSAPQATRKSSSSFLFWLSTSQRPLRSRRCDAQHYHQRAERRPTSGADEKSD